MKRITSIDSLRAFALFGILAIHVRQGFGLGGVNYLGVIDLVLGGGVKYLLESRCMLIFNVLFGVSFYLILRKRDYPASKFVWRCILLMLLGLCNRIIFSNDVLFKYGFCGALLVLIRNKSNKFHYGLIAIFIFLSLYLKSLDLGALLNIPSRYTDNLSFRQYILSYPISLLVLIKQFLNGDFFMIYANMVIGYLLGRSGFVESMDNSVKVNKVILFFVAYIFLGVVYYGHNYLGIPFGRFVGLMTLYLFWYFGAAFYWLFFIWLYNNRSVHGFLKFFDSYGKLGLTNYTFQGFVGVLCFFFGECFFKGNSFSIIFIISLLFFLIQSLFSKLWLSYFKNGPLEYLWRCATEKKWLPIKLK